MFDFSPQREESQVARDLREARRYIERGWCKCSQANAADGEAVGPCSSLAVEWCVGGAVCAAIGTYWTRTKPRVNAAFARLGEASIKLGNVDFVAYNNARATTKSDVLGLIDLAIANELATVRQEA